MDRWVTAKGFSGVVHAPGSKSYVQRALALASLAEPGSQIFCSNWCDDAQAAIGVVRALGWTLDVSEDGVRFVARKHLVEGGTLHCGESGLGVRMFSAVAALRSEPFMLTGEGSLCKRPVSMVESSLRDLGATVSSTEGYLPLRIQGPLLGGTSHLDGKVSSQFLTGLLVALPCAPVDTHLFVSDLASLPYIEMTLEAVRAFGGTIHHRDLQEFWIPGGQMYRPTQFEVEGDWSGAAFLLVAGAVGGGAVEVRRLRWPCGQADAAIIEALEKAGAQVEASGQLVRAAGGTLKGFQFDATHCPDLFPPLLVLAAACAGESRVRGVGRLAHKESDRATALVSLLTSLGGRVAVVGDEMIIQGGFPLRGSTVDSFGDHRIAMAAAVLAVLCEGPVCIRGSECVSKSYPGFFVDLEGLMPLP